MTGSRSWAGRTVSMTVVMGSVFSIFSAGANDQTHAGSAPAGAYAAVASAPQRPPVVPRFADSAQPGANLAGNPLRILSPRYEPGQGSAYTFGAKYPIPRFDGTAQTRIHRPVHEPSNAQEQVGLNYYVPVANYYREQPAAATAGQKPTLLSSLFKRRAPAPQNEHPGGTEACGPVQYGTASWYGKDFHGGKTANGETYDMWSLTAAHRTLPFGTTLKLTNTRNGRECLVRVNNRGPYYGSRVLDVSKGAARELDMLGSGTAKVKMQVVSYGQ